MTKKLTKRLISTLVSLTLVFTLFLMPSTVVQADTTKTSIELAEFGLQAYRDGWQYNYGSYGQINSKGQRISDCSGLIYAYLCWTGDTTNPKPNYNYARSVKQFAAAATESGSISNLPRTHGLVLTVSGNTHIGIYVGNEMSVDNSTYGVNMVYKSVYNRSWVQWHKLPYLEYPTTGWYEFDGKDFYYQDGEYVINTTLVIDGKTYTFDKNGQPNQTPDKGDGFSPEPTTPNVEDKLSISARTTANVNLRTGASTSYGIIGVVGKNTSITITNKDNPDWYKVKLSNGTTGFMSSDYISETDTPSDPEPELSIDAYTTTRVNFRTQPSTSSSVIKVLDSNTSVTIIEKTNASWNKVKLSNGQTGYLYTQYIKVKDTTPTVTPTPTPTVKPTATPTPTPSTSPSTSPSATPKPDADDLIDAKTTANVYLRSGKSTSTSIKQLVKNGTSISIIDKSDSKWYHVKLADGTTGYMYSDYIKIIEETTQPDTTPTPSITYNAKTTSAVHFRAGQGTNTTSLKVLPLNCRIEVLDTSNSSWYKVKIDDGRIGYVYSDYISMDDNSSSKPTVTMTTTSNLNLRSGAGTNHSIITVINKNSKVTVLDKSNSQWYKVTTAGNKTGYVSSDYLK